MISDSELFPIEKVFTDIQKNTHIIVKLLEVTSLKKLNFINAKYQHEHRTLYNFINIEYFS